jgi:prophage maintenance system killer protein
MNGYRLKLRRKDAVRLVESVAAGRIRDWRAISEWLAARAKAA